MSAFLLEVGRAPRGKSSARPVTLSLGGPTFSPEMLRQDIQHEVAMYHGPLRPLQGSLVLQLVAVYSGTVPAERPGCEVRRRLRHADV